MPRLKLQRVNQPHPELIAEWVESPVTQYFKWIALDTIEALQDSARTTDVYAPFEPSKTQERLAALNGAIDSWEDVVEALDGEGVLLEYVSREEAEDEIGD
jgi:hypothetical protein